MMKFKQLLVAAFLVALPFTPMLVTTSVRAASTNDPIENLNDVADDAEFEGDEDSLPSTIGKIINVLLGFLGIIFLVLIIYAGLLWMTAGGDPDQVKKARSILLNSVIGLVILLSAYAISAFVLDRVTEATTTS